MAEPESNEYRNTHDICRYNHSIPVIGASAMQIGILALGSRGDVQPVIPLGQGLQQAGHRVKIATFESFAEMVHKAGLELVPIRGDAVAILKAAGGSEGVEKADNPLHAFRAIKRSYGMLAKSMPNELSALNDSQLILNQLPGNLFGPDLAEFLRVPLGILAVIPMVSTHTRPLFGFPSLPIAAYNRWTYWAGNQIAWQMFRSAVNRWRVDRLHLASRPFFGGKPADYPVINGFSPLVVERPDDWGNHVHITGWWQPDDPDWQPPVDLLRFLDGGPEPVFIGFGSMPVRNPHKTSAAIIEAVKISGKRAILHAGWGGLGGQITDKIYLMEYAPYRWLFPRMSGIIHHGGSGTTGFALHSGTPSCVAPFLFDQYYWGKRTAALGAGPPPLPFRSLTASRLAAKIVDLTENFNYKNGASALGAALGEEKGVETAVQLIDHLFG
jgi:sterol 3beta-glucosyltransferase